MLRRFFWTAPGNFRTRLVDFLNRSETRAIKTGKWHLVLCYLYSRIQKLKKIIVQLHEELRSLVMVDSIDHKCNVGTEDGDDKEGIKRDVNV